MGGNSVFGLEDPAEQEYVPEAIADQDDDGKLCLWMSKVLQNGLHT